MTYILIFYAVISFIAFFLTVYDKNAAQAGKWRVSEKALLITGFAGGACAEWLTMRLIRHKTRKKKFMVTLPVLAALHLALIILLYFFVFQRV